MDVRRGPHRSAGRAVHDGIGRRRAHGARGRLPADRNTAASPACTPVPDELLLFLNLDLLAAARHESIPSELLAMVGAAGLLPRNVAVEFLEARLEEVARFGALAAELRHLGFLVVLDDVGAGHSNLNRIPLFGTT